MQDVYRAAHPESALDEAAAALSTGTPSAAAEYLRADAARDASSRDAAVLWAQQRLAVGDLAGAATLVHTLWRHAPEDAATYALASHLYERDAQTQEAARCARWALVFDNRRAEYWARYEALHERPTWPMVYDVVIYAGHPRLGAMPLPSQVLSRPIGGSESMALLMARGLAQRGLRVALCSNYAAPQVDEGVACLPLEDFYLLQRYAKIPIAIVSRFSQPFLNQCTADQRIFWLHDIVAASYASVYAQMDPQVDQYWALSAYQQDLYVARCGLRAEKFWRTTNVIDPAWWSARVPHAARIPGRMMYISRPGRGLAEALMIYEQLQTCVPAASLVVCTYTKGNVWDDPELQPLRDRLQSLPGIALHSFAKPELLQRLSESMLLLYPNASAAETSCLAAIEAQATGTPVLTSDRGCLAETVQHGVSGVVLPWAENAACPLAQFTDAARGLLTDAAQWNALSAGAWERARERHDIARVAADWHAQIIR